MLCEKKIIEIINREINKKCKSLDRNNEQDSVTFSVSNSKFLFTIDDFSHEDQFRENNPYSLGWNMVIGGVSDILASGGIPKFYGHSLVVAENWTEDYITKLSNGIADAIKTADMTFIGGDLGKSLDWKYTASIIGEAPEIDLNRIGAKPNDQIFMSGKIGAGNFEAALNLYQSKLKMSGLLKTIKTRFPYRISHSQLMKKYATCSIDTSDGVFNALDTITELNNCGFYINNLQYISKASMLAKILSLPKELLFFGECGEYELLFTVNDEKVEEFIKEAKQQSLEYLQLGKIIKNEKIVEIGKRKIDISRFDIRARDFENISDYLKELIQKLKE